MPVTDDQGSSQRSPDHLSVFQVCAYGFPGIVITLAEFPIILYLPTFYAVDLGLGLAAVGYVFAVIRIIDVLTDPIIGTLSDRINTRFGRRKPLLTIAFPLFAVATYHLFSPQNATLATLAISLTAAYLMYGIVEIPYNAMAGELTNNKRKITFLYGAKSVFLVLGTLLSALILQLYPQDTGAGLHAIGVSALPMAIISIIIIIFILPKEMKVIPSKKIIFTQYVHLVFSHKKLWKLFSAFFLNQTGNAFAAGLVVLYIEKYLKLGNEKGIFLGSLFLFSALGLPIWFALERWIGQSRCWSISIISSCVIFIIVPFLSPGDYAIYFFVCITAGITFGCDSVLPASMLAQRLSHDKKLSSADRAGHLFSIKVLLSKISLIAPVLIAFPILSMFDHVDLDGPVETHWHVMLVFFYSIFPVLFKLPSIFILLSEKDW